MFYYFWSQANVTAFEIGFDVIIEDWPVVFLGNKLSNLLNSKMTNQWFIVILADQPYIKNFRYVW